MTIILKASRLFLLVGMMPLAAFAQPAASPPSPPPDAPAPASGAEPGSEPQVPVSMPSREDFHIYILMGQSNMAGRDARNLPPPLNNPHVLALNSKGQWVLAKEPLHPTEDKKVAGVGPGIPFALEMLRTNPNITIGLVPCAVGGTPLKRWVKGGDLYEKALKRAKIAAASGTLSGVLWHQGETDAKTKEDSETYEARLSKMLVDLRADLGLPNVPIVVGQIGDFLDPAKEPYADVVRTAIKRIPQDVPGVGYADSAGLVDKGDKLHFTADCQQELGKRFAQAMRTINWSNK